MTERRTTPPTRQPATPEEGGSVGPEAPSMFPPMPPTELPDHGIEQHPHRAPLIPPMEIPHHG